MLPILLLSVLLAPPRPFHLGFTPFPYDISFEAIDFSYQELAKDGDLVVHSIDDGVPWDEAYANGTFPKKVREDWADRVKRTPKGHTVYVQVNPLNLYKNAIADDVGELRTGDWSKRRLDDDKVERAFLNYCERAIATFHPDYLGFIETNLLRTNSPTHWAEYVNLHKWLYRELKARHPKLPVFNTFVATSILQGYAPEYNHVEQVATIKELAPYNDVFAVSLYPFMGVYTAEKVPADLFDKLRELNPGKPMTIAESGYPAAEFSIQNGKIPFHGTPAKQAAFVRRLLDAAQRDRYLFVNNFVIRDYEALWVKIGKTDIAAVWKNTGLYDADGKERPALATWRQELARPYGR